MRITEDKSVRTEGCLVKGSLGQERKRAKKKGSAIRLHLLPISHASYSFDLRN